MTTSIPAFVMIKPWSGSERRWGTLLRVVAIALGLWSGESKGEAQAGPAPLVLRLWPEGPLGPAADRGEERMEKDGSAAQVSVPEMSVYLADPARATGVALVICAGGSYTRVTESFYRSGWPAEGIELEPSVE